MCSMKPLWLLQVADEAKKAADKVRKEHDASAKVYKDASDAVEKQKKVGGKDRHALATPRNV